MRRLINKRVVAVSAVVAALSGATTAAATRATTGRILFQSLAPGGGDTLYTMNSSGADVQRLRLKVADSAISPDWSPDGKRVAFAVQVGDSQSIWTADANGQNAEKF